MVEVKNDTISSTYINHLESIFCDILSDCPANLYDALWPIIDKKYMIFDSSTDRYCWMKMRILDFINLSADVMRCRCLRLKMGALLICRGVKKGKTRGKRGAKKRFTARCETFYGELWTVNLSWIMIYNPFTPR